MRYMKLFRLVLLTGIFAIGTSLLAAPCSSAQELAAEPTYEVVQASKVKWEHLNPARGDKSPQAGTLWGDRNGTEPTGYLLKPADGFESPPHIHNVSYRGVVISGLLHNDDPDAENMWMPTGSFWTQPAGEVHITAAKGNDALAYIEIEKGPYLVLPPEEAFDNGERPVNVDKSNIVWLDAADITWLDQPGKDASADGAKMAFLWGKPQQDQLSGTLVMLPAGFTGKIQSHGSSFRAIVILGQPLHQIPGMADTTTLEPGSYFSSRGEAVHQISSGEGKKSIIYVRSKGRYEVISAGFEQ